MSANTVSAKLSSIFGRRTAVTQSESSETSKHDLIPAFDIPVAKTLFEIDICGFGEIIEQHVGELEIVHVVIVIDVGRRCSNPLCISIGHQSRIG